MATALDRIARRIANLLGIESSYVATSAAHHHVYDTGGTAPLVVCLPGLSDSAASWLPVMLALRRRGHRVMVIEAAGHGLSEQANETYTIDAHFEAITEAFDQLVTAPAIVVGNSLGGATAMHVAVARPALVRALYLASPGGAHFGEAALADVKKAFDIQSGRDARAFLRRVLHRVSPIHAALASVIPAYMKSRAVRELIASLKPETVIEGVETIAAPVHVAWGKSERLLPPESLQWLRDHLPAHATFSEPERFGHSPHLDDPLRFAKLVDDFIATV